VLRSKWLAETRGHPSHAKNKNKNKKEKEKDGERKCLLLDGVGSKLLHIAEYLALTPSIFSIGIHFYIQGPT
jgi:hypothetical protein